MYRSAVLQPRSQLSNVQARQGPSSVRAIAYTQSRIPGAAFNRSRYPPVFHQAASNNTETQANREILEAFFLGKAFAEVLNERLGEAASELLSEVGKFTAEFGQNTRDFEAEVRRRAQLELTGGEGVTSSASTVVGTAATPAATAVDIIEIVDDLRAEVASARSALLQLKNKQAQKTT